MKVNHRRLNPSRYPEVLFLNNGYVTPVNVDGLGSKQTKTLRTWRYIDKSMKGWGRVSLFADVLVGASIGNDFSNGHRGRAKAVRGAKKYVRSRIRAKEKMQLKSQDLTQD